MMMARLYEKLRYTRENNRLRILICCLSRLWKCQPLQHSLRETFVGSARKTPFVHAARRFNARFNLYFNNRIK